MTLTGLAPQYRGRDIVPVLGKVTVIGCTDRVLVTMVSGQCPADFADRAEGIAHGFRAYLCRVRTAWPGAVVLELVRRDALAEPMPALPIPAVTDLSALPVGRCEDATVFTICLRGTHLLIAGATGAGKGSYLWSLIRAMLAAMAAGLVEVWACDPKLMELAFGRALFTEHGRYAADPADIADLLENAVAAMQARARRFAGRQRDHTPTPDQPFVVVMVDEIAFLTAYQAGRKLRERTLAALATLTTQGRAVGFCVVAALQDPRKEVLNIGKAHRLRPRHGGCMTACTTRMQRLAMPMARDVVRDLAVEHGGCVRPVQLRRTDLETGNVTQVLVPCGNERSHRSQGLSAAQDDPRHGS